jgi:hypothetical protein
MSSAWTHACCDPCWHQRQLGFPARIRQIVAEVCCYCGQPTVSGIYVRDNPLETPYCQHRVDVPTPMNDADQDGA